MTRGNAATSGKPPLLKVVTLLPHLRVGEFSERQTQSEAGAERQGEVITSELERIDGVKTD